VPPGVSSSLEGARPHERDAGWLIIDPATAAVDRDCRNPGPSLWGKERGEGWGVPDPPPREENPRGGVDPSPSLPPLVFGHSSHSSLPLLCLLRDRQMYVVLYHPAAGGHAPGASIYAQGIAEKEVSC